MFHILFSTLLAIVIAVSGTLCASADEEVICVNVGVSSDTGHDPPSTDVSLLQTSVYFSSANSLKPISKTWDTSPRKTVDTPVALTHDVRPPRVDANSGLNSLRNMSSVVPPRGNEILVMARGEGETRLTSAATVRTVSWSHYRLLGKLELGEASTFVWTVGIALIFGALLVLYSCGRTAPSETEATVGLEADLKNDMAEEEVTRVCTEERVAVEHLPDLRERIERMGLTHEYAAFRERYLAWRTGSAHGAECQPNHVDIARRYEGFGYWYPNTETWAWRRTLSFWIAVTFFEGSVCFAMSSCFYNYADKYYGHYAKAVTTFGYVVGKVNYFICTYLMCVQTLNLSSERSNTEFVWWPFNFRRAMARLEQLGAGPYPYYASVTYFIAVNVFVIGLAFEFAPVDHDVASLGKALSFTVGSILFVLGGVAECVENEVFTRAPKLRDVVGWWGALLNLIGGIWFLLGSILMFFSEQTYMANVSFGIGAIVYAMGSGAMIVMWKDEQFGLTFLAVLNKLGGENGRPLTKGDDDDIAWEKNTFSWTTAFFIIIYILAATLSIYDCLLAFADLSVKETNWVTAVVLPFNNLLPCIFTHGFLAVNCAVVKVPGESPFHELFIGCRILAIAMVFVSSADLVFTLRNAERTTVTTLLLRYMCD